MRVLPVRLLESYDTAPAHATGGTWFPFCLSVSKVPLELRAIVTSNLLFRVCV